MGSTTNKQIKYFLEWLKTISMTISKLNWQHGRVLLTQNQNINSDGGGQSSPKTEKTQLKNYSEFQNQIYSFICTNKTIGIKKCEICWKEGMTYCLWIFYFTPHEIFILLKVTHATHNFVSPLNYLVGIQNIPAWTWHASVFCLFSSHCHHTYLLTIIPNNHHFSLYLQGKEIHTAYEVE